MSRRSSTFADSTRRRVALVLMTVVAVITASERAWAQACCAGSGAVTPGRLAVHEDALVAVQQRAAHAFGSFDSNGHYATPAAGSSEQDFEQDLIGAWRVPVLDRMQLAAQLPFVETRRTTRGNAEVGGGIGDANVSARYDFLYAGRDRYVPGIAAPIVGISGVAPVSDYFRFQGGFTTNPPIPSLGKNQPATVGLSVTALYVWY